MNMLSKIAAVIIMSFSMTALAEEPVAAQAQQDFNPFADSYVSRMPAPAAVPAAPKLFAGRDKVADYYRLLQDGYELLGYSSFRAGHVPPEKLSEQAASLHSDLVMVYTEGVDRLPGASASGSTQSSDEDPTLYEYFASYWVKLPTPLLGLHVQRYTPEPQVSGGLEVLAVVLKSPAALAGLQRGDILLRLGDVELRQPEELVQAAQRYAGQSVDVRFRRDDAEMHTNVTLNSL